jgi:predicted amidophosphoribosyltransferase
MLAALLDLILPRRCLTCGGPGSAFCLPCRPDSVREVDVGGLPVLAAGEYGGRLRSAILAYKERGRLDLLGPLAQLMVGPVAALAEEHGAAVVLIPVPSSARASRERGGDHLLRLSRQVSKLSGLPTVAALRLNRAVRDSAGLGIEQRWRNLDQAMVADGPAGVRAAILVDDIVTTGATLAESARALRQAGWQVAAATVLGATPRLRLGEP